MKKFTVVIALAIALLAAPAFAATPYESVNSILRSVYGWNEFVAPEPASTNARLQTASPEYVAASLDAKVRSVVAAGLPWGMDPKDGYAWACRQLFTVNQKYWGLNTQIAFGQVVELPVDTIGAANSPTEWWNHQEKLRNRLGEKLCSAEEFARRKLYVTNVPLEWTAWSGGALIYQLAVREGYFPVGMERFDPAYLQSNPKLRDVRGLDALQWLENLKADSARKPRPWLAGGVANPAAK